MTLYLPLACFSDAWHLLRARSGQRDDAKRVLSYFVEADGSLEALHTSVTYAKGKAFHCKTLFWTDD